MKPYTRGFFTLSALGLALLWVGCGSTVPIDASSEAVFVPELVGQWQTMASDPDEGQMLVLQFDEQSYYVELREAGTEPFDKDVIRLRAYITEVDGKAFINAQNIDSLDDTDRVYFFYAYDLSPEGLLTLTELKDVDGQEIDKFESSEALRAFIRQNLNNEALYGETMTMMKVNVAG